MLAYLLTIEKKYTISIGKMVQTVTDILANHSAAIYSVRRGTKMMPGYTDGSVAQMADIHFVIGEE